MKFHLAFGGRMSCSFWGLKLETFYVCEEKSQAIIPSPTTPSLLYGIDDRELF